MPYTSLLLQGSSVVNEHGLEVREVALDATERSSSMTARWIQGERPGGDGGAGRDRTGDPLVANQVLSQLSYSPEEWWA